MPDPSQRQALGDAIRGELLTALHAEASLDALVDRVVDCVDAHPPVPEVSLRQLSHVAQLEQRIAALAWLADENIDLKLERDALRSIVRRYRTGHHVMYGPNDLYAWVHPDEPGEEPMTPAEVAALAAHNPQDGTDG